MEASAGYVVHRILFRYQSCFHFSRKTKLHPTSLLSLFSDVTMPEKETSNPSKQCREKFCFEMPKRKIVNSNCRSL